MFRCPATLRYVLILFGAAIAPMPRAAADVVILPLYYPITGNPFDFHGVYDTAQQPAGTQLEVDLGIQFSRIDTAVLRVLGEQQLGSASILGSSGHYPFSAEVYVSLVGDDNRSAAVGDDLLPVKETFDTPIPLLGARYHAPPDFSPLLDGKIDVDVNFYSPPMIAITVVDDDPVVSVDNGAFIVAGDTLGQLAGDYDRDGVVYVHDYTLWRDSFGTDLEPGTGADGNGNGVVDVADYVVWRNHFGVSIRPTDGYLAGDFDYNGIVEAADYVVWRDKMGTNVPRFTGADANGDGTIDRDDFSIWKSQFGERVGSTSAVGGSVPEPATVMMLAAGALALLGFRWHSN